MSSNHANEGRGLSSCYIFKSLLQEYAQKNKHPAPVYSTGKEGPSHEPTTFRSTVVVNGVKYRSLPGFFSPKAAEQSAAEVALMQLANSGTGSESNTQPVYGVGLCKNLLQVYAQKMNYATPLYECHMNVNRGRCIYYCSVEVGGTKYTGAKTNTKKDAEIKAARAALLAIHSAESGPAEKPGGDSGYTVTPSKSNPQFTASLKPKKYEFFKKKIPSKKHAGVLGSKKYS